MVDDKKQFDDNEEEYHFSEEELERELSEYEKSAESASSSQHVDEVGPSSAGSVDSGGRKRPTDHVKSLLEKRGSLRPWHWVVGAVLLLFVVAWGAHFIGQAKTPSQPTETTAKETGFKPLDQHIAEQNQDQTSQQQGANEQAQAAGEQQAQENAKGEQLKGHVEKLSDKQKQHEDQLDKLWRASAKRFREIAAESKSVDSQLDALQSNVSELQSNMQDIRSDLSLVTTQLTKMQQAQEVKKKQIVARKTPAMHLPNYFVEAVVPGRAWLQSSIGTTITVAIGDTIRGYGEVTKIDPYTGNVTLSSGKVFEYGTGAY
ncbi:MAG: hypothetical protein ACE365_03850 [Gammaproteobacteria bacterium]